MKDIKIESLTVGKLKEVLEQFNDDVNVLFPIGHNTPRDKVGISIYTYHTPTSEELKLSDILIRPHFSTMDELAWEYEKERWEEQLKLGEVL